MNTITAAFAYIQFIVHLLTFLLVHQVAQWVKLHNIHIEEQSKKKKHERGTCWNIKLGPASVKTSCVGEL